MTMRRDEEIWYWVQHLELAEVQKLGGVKYCEIKITIISNSE